MQSLTEHILLEADGSLPLELFWGLDSQIIQNEQIEKHSKNGPPLMLINPVDRLGAYAVIQKLRMQDVPVIFFNRQPLPSDIELWDQVWYVGARAEDSGRMQAELVKKLFGSDPENLNRHDRNGDGMIQTCILKGQQGHQDTEIRTSSVQKTLLDGGYMIDVQAIETANWSRDEGFEKMDELLGLFPDSFELVLANNDAMALGAIDAMKACGFFTDDSGNGTIGREDESWIPVLGIDGIPAAVRYIEDGYLYATVLNDFRTMAAAIIDLATAITAKRNGKNVRLPDAEDRCIWIDYQTFSLE